MLTTHRRPESEHTADNSAYEAQRWAQHCAGRGAHVWLRCGPSTRVDERTCGARATWCQFVSDKRATLKLVCRIQQNRDNATASFTEQQQAQPPPLAARR